MAAQFIMTDSRELSKQSVFDVRLVGAGFINLSELNNLAERALVSGDGSQQRRFIEADVSGDMHTMLPIFFALKATPSELGVLAPALWGIKQVRAVCKDGSDLVLCLGTLDQWRQPLAYSGKHQHPIVNRLAEAVYVALRQLGFGPYITQGYRVFQWNGITLFERRTC